MSNIPDRISVKKVNISYAVYIHGVYNTFAHTIYAGIAQTFQNCIPCKLACDLFLLT